MNNISSNRNIWMAGLVVPALLALSATYSNAGEVYKGEPLAEALFDLSSSAILVSHPMGSATELKRTDVFKLRDGRYVAIVATAEKTDEPFTVREIRVGSKTAPSLTAESPIINSLAFPDSTRGGSK